MKAYIPLSWSHKRIEYPKFESVNLSLSQVPWIYSAEIPTSFNIEELVKQLDLNYSDGFLLRGCGVELAKYLSQKGYDVIRTGAEGIVDLDNIDRITDSVANLSRRGQKLGTVIEIELTNANRERVSSFIDLTPYGLKPHLKYLFNTSFNSNTRCFVMASHEDKWLGVVTISYSGSNSCHCEMILRNRKAPVGVMELLFLSVMKILKLEGRKSLSLGEVPFVTPDSMEICEIDTSIKRSIQESLLFKSGHLLKYAFNYKGLYDFKNKFNPEWKPVYICSSPKVSFLSLIDIFFKTGYFELSRKELIPYLSSYSNLSSFIK